MKSNGALASAAGVGYATAWRAVNGVAIGVDVARRVASALGFGLGQVTADPEERRPADGFSPQAVGRFNRLLRPALQRAIRDVYQEVAAEAARRCWHWPRIDRVLRRLALPVLMREGGTRAR